MPLPKIRKNGNEFINCSVNVIISSQKLGVYDILISSKFFSVWIGELEATNTTNTVPLSPLARSRPEIEGNKSLPHEDRRPSC